VALTGHGHDVSQFGQRHGVILGEAEKAGSGAGLGLKL